MGIVYEEITLRNAVDVGAYKRGLITEQEIRQITITAIVDTGAATLVISHELRRQLGLEINGTSPARQADNMPVTVYTAEPVEVHWNNRQMTCEPWVFSETGTTLLGAIPLENMDLMVDPKNQVLVGVHGDQMLGRL